MRTLGLVLFATLAYGAWDDVQRVAPDRRVEVSLQKETLRGAFVSANDAGLTLRLRSGEQTVARAAIRRVRVADSSRRARNALIGAAVGAGIGAGAGWAICIHCANEGVPAKYIAPLAGVLGGVGFVAGLLTPSYRTLYKDR